jgi:hypothetical protein
MSCKRVRLENLADLESGELGKHEIQDDQRRRFLPRPAQAISSIAGRNDIEATGPLKGAGEHFDDIFLVFDEENLLIRSGTHEQLPE